MTFLITLFCGYIIVGQLGNFVEWFEFEKRCL